MVDEGTTLRSGRYVVTRSLGEGSQGDTLEAVDKQAGRLVAIKRFQVRGAKRWKDVELAEREARVLESLSHPALPAHVEHFEEGGALYLVMEKIEGESLASLRKRGAMLGRGDVVRFLREAATILDYLHGRAPPVIHRDVKPGNVIRRPDGSFALVDFGAVRDRMRPEGGSTVVGTFGYMAPEQFQGRAQPSSDVYAVGATALAMLTGQEPEDLPHKGLAIDVRAALGERADPALVEVLSAMVEPDPDKRPGAIRPLLVRLGAQGPERERTRERERERTRERGRERTRERGRERTREREAGAWVVEHARRVEEQHRKMARRAWKERSRRDSEYRLTGFPLLVATLALSIARVAVALAIEVVVPLLLSLLSIVLGRPLRVAAQRVREAGREGQAEISRAQARISGRVEAGAAQGAASGPRAGQARVRVAEPAAAERGGAEGSLTEDQLARDLAERQAQEDRERVEAQAEAEAAEEARRGGRSTRR
ncbi:MAG: serine/threonine protein kinase [Polyangiaceae bacterium]|nr:serine/threonine protein kinase [Polyangiaceae bacterium]